MAESADKAERSAEEAYAAAAAQASPEKSEVAHAETASVATDQPATSVAPEAHSKTTEPAINKPATARRKISKPRRAAALKAKAAPVTKPVPTVSELKDKIMATAKTTEFSKPFADAFGDVQTKAKAAYDTSAEIAAEATEFAKGNAEALVESGKIYAAGVQNLGKAYAEEAKSAYETFTADLKEVAAVKSPAELFQLQSKFARRNFDAWVAFGSRHTDAAIKLTNEAFAPLSGRISLAAEKIGKAA
jgi:phasin family protein